MELPDIKEFNKSRRVNRSKHNKKVANDIPVVFKEQYNSIVTVHSVPRACLKNHSRNLHAPLCGILCPNSVVVVSVFL